MTKRARIALVIVCLLLGAASNYPVAWVCAIWSQPDPSVFVSTPPSEIQQLERKFQSEHWNAIENSNYRMQSFGKVLDHINGTKTVLSLQVGWPLICVAGQCIFDEHLDERVMKWGLPSENSLKSDKDSEYRGILRIPESFPRLGIEKGQWLPFQPRFAGFAFNTLFYAALSWLVIRLPFESRRRLRGWRGLCGRCAYPIGASTLCIECGTPVRGKPVAVHQT
jgi:hypothetical protein